MGLFKRTKKKALSPNELLKNHISAFLSSYSIKLLFFDRRCFEVVAYDGNDKEIFNSILNDIQQGISEAAIYPIYYTVLGYKITDIVHIEQRPIENSYCIQVSGKILLRDDIPQCNEVKEAFKEADKDGNK